MFLHNLYFYNFLQNNDIFSSLYICGLAICRGMMEFLPKFGPEVETHDANTHIYTARRYQKVYLHNKAFLGRVAGGFKLE